MEASSSVRNTAAAADVVGRVRADVEGLVDRLTRRIQSEVPFYRAGGIATQDLRQRLLTNIQAALAGLLGARHDPAAPAETGRLRARQDAPLADVLAAYRLGYTEISAAVIQAARTAPAIEADLVIDFGHTVFETHNRDAEALMEAYRDEAQQLLLQRERERTALFDILLMDEPGTGTLLDAARVLRLPMQGSFVVIAAASEHGQDPMPRVGPALAALDVTGVWRLHYEVAIAVLSMPDPNRLAPALAVLRRHATGPVGVSPVFRSLRRTAWALDLAQLVLRRTTGTHVEHFEASPLNLLVAGGRDCAHETAQSVIGGLLSQAAATRDILIETLLTWADAGGSADRTGELLHCHPNTIRKRLKRIEAHTGRRLTEPTGVAELIASVHAWQQLRPR